MTSNSIVFSTNPQYQPSAPSLPENTPPSWFTNTKIKQIILSVFATLALVAAALLTTAAVVGFIASPAGWVAAPVTILVLLAGGAIYYAATRKDYENPKELQKMKEKALCQDFRELYKEHGPENLKKIYSPDEPESSALHFEKLQKKFQMVVNSSNFFNLYDEYKLSKLASLGIAPWDLVHCINKLNNQAIDAENTFRLEMNSLDRLYPGRTERVQQDLKQVSDQASLGFAIGNMSSQSKHKFRDQVIFDTVASGVSTIAGMALGATNSAVDQQTKYEMGKGVAFIKRNKTVQGLQTRFEFKRNEFFQTDPFVSI